MALLLFLVCVFNRLFINGLITHNCEQGNEMFSILGYFPFFYINSCCVMKI